ncbi:uncharacterized protein BDZ99DRAFT_501724, partial [Mytilinidion resinicola]
METPARRDFGDALEIKVAPGNHAVRVGALFLSRRAFEKAVLDRIVEPNHEFKVEDFDNILVYVHCAHIFRPIPLLRHIYSPTEDSCKCPKPGCWSNLFWPGDEEGPYTKSALIKTASYHVNEKALKAALLKCGDIEDFDFDRQKRSIFVEF